MSGIGIAVHLAVGVRRLEDLVAFRLAVDFKLEVYRLLRESPRATQDVRYRSQLQDAALSVEANLAEGWHRFRATEMAPFLRYALGSLAEARHRVDDGVARGYFQDDACRHARALAGQCSKTLVALLRSLPHRR